jgi:hypothetical protein
MSLSVLWWIRTQINLQSYLDVRSSQVLNADAKTNLASVLSVTEGVLRSDVDIDHELIIVVSFTEAVKIRGVRLKATEAKSDGEDDASGPKTVKLFREKPHLGFNECHDDKPTELLTFTKEQLTSGEEIRVKFALFQNVTSLTIFIATNQDDTPVTFLNQLSFVGSVVAGTKMGELKPQEH